MTKERSTFFHSAAKYSWRLGKLHLVEHYVKLKLQHEKMCIGIDHPGYALCQNFLTQVQNAMKDRNAYESTKLVSYLDDEDRPTRSWPKYENIQAQRHKEQLEPALAQHRRLLDWEKALSWGVAELDRNMNLFIVCSRMVPHIVLKRNFEDMVYLKKMVRSMQGDVNVGHHYGVIGHWLEVC